MMKRGKRTTVAPINQHSIDGAGYNRDSVESGCGHKGDVFLMGVIFGGEPAATYFSHDLVMGHKLILEAS
jgi:hypothetical protein